MTMRGGLATLAALGFSMLLAACGGGSGRSGTDLVVSGVGPATQLNGGDSATFTMTVSNLGDFAASNVVIRNATVQVSQSAISITCTAGGGATCPTATGTVMTVPVLPAGGSLVFTITGSVNAGASGTISDTMSASADVGDVNQANNSFTVTGAVVSNDVSVTITPPAGPLVNGPTTFTAVVTNAGPNTAENVVLTTTASSDLTFSPSDVTCVPSAGASGATLQTDGTLLVASIPLNGTLTCNIPVIVADATNGFAIVSMASATVGDARASNDTGTASANATLVHDLTIVGTAPSTPLGAGAATFTMVVTNLGPATASNVSLTTTVSASLTLDPSAITCVATGGAVVPTVQANGTLLSPAIPTNGVLTCSIPVTVADATSTFAAVTMSTGTVGDLHPADNSATATATVSSNLGVTQAGATQVAAGSPTAFVAVVSNPGPATATNLTINWTHGTTTGVTFDTPTCSGSAGATCPTTLGSTMTVPSLAVGRTLTFTFNVSTDASVRGTITNTVSVTSTEDTDLSNNVATATTTAVDAHNGTYTVFAANGKSYSLSIDFDAGTYTMSGNGQTTQKTFTLDASGDYVVSGDARLRLGQDIMIGAHDFGSGLVPFVGARTLVTNLASLAGSYDLATRNVPTAGSPTTHAGMAVISGNTLSVCQSDTGQVIVVKNCDAASRKDYLNLSVSGNVFTGTTTGGEQYSFSVANVGGLKVLLSAGQAPDTSQQFRIGLIDSAAGLTFGPPLRGPSSTGEWLAMTLSNSTNPPTYSATLASSPSTTTDSATLVDVNSNAAPFSMLTGTDAPRGADIYLMQSSPLVVVVGNFAQTASGLLQIGLP